MEMIVATAILAGSGAALFTLIGQGSLFGRRAEEQATALQLAQSVLAETLAMPDAVDQEGTFEQDARWAYRVRRERSVGSASAGEAAGPAASGSASPLVRLIVEVFPVGERGGGPGEQRATCRLVRWVREAQETNARNDASQAAGSASSPPLP